MKFYLHFSPCNVNRTAGFVYFTQLIDGLSEWFSNTDLLS